jgi:hypothetical protein
MVLFHRPEPEPCVAVIASSLSQQVWELDDIRRDPPRLVL